MADNSNNAFSALIQALMGGQPQGQPAAPPAIGGQQAGGIDPKVLQALLAKLLGGAQ